MSGSESDGGAALSPSAEQRARIADTLRLQALENRSFFLGLVLAVGSAGLLLGGATVCVAGIAMLLGAPLIPSLIMGFFLVGGLGAAVGMRCLTVGLKTFRSKSPGNRGDG